MALAETPAAVYERLVRLSGCWYEPDGTTFECNSYDCPGAAHDVASYCQTEEEDDSGCTVSASQPSSGGGLWVAAGAMLTLLARRRRQRA